MKPSTSFRCRAVDGRQSDYLVVAQADRTVVSVMLNPLNSLKKPAVPSMGRRAVVDETVIAEASDTQRVDGYEYFPPDSVNWELLEASDRTSVCPWKGVASYYDVVVDGHRLPAAAWSYKTPSPAAEHIKGHVAFWRGVKVIKS